MLRWGNPLTPLVESVHEVAFFGEWPSAGQLVYVGVHRRLRDAGILSSGASSPRWRWS